MTEKGPQERRANDAGVKRDEGVNPFDDHLWGLAFTLVTVALLLFIAAILVAVCRLLIFTTSGTWMKSICQIIQMLRGQQSDRCFVEMSHDSALEASAHWMLTADISLVLFSLGGLFALGFIGMLVFMSATEPKRGS